MAHARTGVVQSSERVTKDDGRELVEVTVDAGGGELLTLEHVADAGDDSLPLPDDFAGAADSTGQGALRSAGYANTKTKGKALPGEKRIYARDPADGSVVCEIWLKGPGKIAISALKDGADIELSTAVSGGKVIINGVVIDKDGSIKAPGEVTAMTGGASVSLSTHLHPTGVGPTDKPTPGT